MARPGSSGDPLYTVPEGVSAAATRKTVVGTDVAANTEFSETVPANKQWKLLSVSVQLVQGATQTPRPILVIDDGTNVFYASLGATGAQVASTTARYNWAPGLTISALTGTTPDIHAFAPLPDDLILPAGYRIRSTTGGIGANSNYGPPVLFVVEYA